MFYLIWKYPIIKGSVYNDIKKAYFGGFVDIYIPFAKNVNSYDVNSLYPSTMAKCPMPVGNPVYVEGSTLSLNDIFGFVYVKVIAPKIHTPILPYRHKNKSGSISTLYPIGTWEGWYFSEELKNATKYGYKFNVLKGYNFKKATLFSNYVENLFDIKKSVTSDNPWYIISKLLLNSLYGRFGMSPAAVQWALKIFSSSFSRNFSYSSKNYSIRYKIGDLRSSKK